MNIELDATRPVNNEIHIALDFDGTLAHYESWDKQGNKVGKPIKKMVDNVKLWLSKGYKVTIFTARLSHSIEEAEKSSIYIKQFLKECGLPELPITSVKMYYFSHFIDDKAYNVKKNSGIIEGLEKFEIYD